MKLPMETPKNATKVWSYMLLGSWYSRNKLAPDIQLPDQLFKAPTKALLTLRARASKYSDHAKRTQHIISFIAHVYFERHNTLANDGVRRHFSPAFPTSEAVMGRISQYALPALCRSRLMTESNPGSSWALFVSVAIMKASD